MLAADNVGYLSAFICRLGVVGLDELPTNSELMMMSGTEDWTGAKY
jgi:hypothetical protein